MSIKTVVENGAGGSSYLQKVYSNNAAKVYVSNVPIDELTNTELTQLKLLSGQLVNSGSSPNANVSASADNLREFFVEADTTNLLSINQVRFAFEGSQLDITTAESRRFGAAAAAPGLSNGLKFIADQGGVETEIFVSPVKKIGDFYLYASSRYNNEIITDKDAISAGTDFLQITLEFLAPINLVPGTQDKLKLVVQDDLSSIDSFTIQYYGTQQKKNGEL
jgi:hypothetical protein